MRALLLLLILSAATYAAEKPNIVLILADDLGINDLACYGRAEHHTPNLDQLASEGMRFTAAYCAQPICSPSRAALMTGKCPARLHLTNFLPGRADAPSQKLLQPRIEGQLPLEEITIAELLRDAGYATGCFGKWHLGGDGFGPSEQGFGTVLITQPNTKPSATEGGKGEYAVTAAAVSFIEANKDKPFFCYVPHNTPHIPLGAKAELMEKNKAAFNPTYAAMIESLDDTVGILMRKVTDLGLAERTVFIFTSDNGGLHVLEAPTTPATHNTPSRAGKGYLYEGGIREPLIIRWPGKVPAAKLCESPVVLTDLVPTLLEFAGVDTAKTSGPLDGVSLAKLLRAEPMPPRTLYWHFPNYTNQGGRPASALRDGDWKLVEQLEDNSLELYNLANDPSETKNLAATEAKTAEELHKKLTAWRLSVGAQMPVPNPAFVPAQHRAIYEDADSSSLKPDTTAALTAPKWQAWHTAMSAAIKGQRVLVTPAKGDIRLFGDTAKIHGEKARYEPQSYKNTVGFWVNKDDWAEWDFTVPAAGSYEIEITQGAGKGSGGAEVAVEIAGQTFKFIVQETGHFQNFIQRTIGTVQLPAGPANIAVKPQTKPGGAVMDLRRIVLRPL